MTKPARRCRHCNVEIKMMTYLNEEFCSPRCETAWANLTPEERHAKDVVQRDPIDPESGILESTIDAAMRALYGARTAQVRARGGREEITDDEWQRIKGNVVHAASMPVLREEAIRMIEEGEWDD